MASAAKKTTLSGSVNKSDRISNLPMNLLHHILSSLPSHNMVQTCILSKNWRNIWCSTPDLDINYYQMNSTCFEQFVDFLLLTRDGSNIHKFSFFIEPGLKSDDSESEAEDEDQPPKFDLSPTKVNAWILYALRHNVEVLEITSYMSLTPLLFSCGSLRELKLTLTSNSLGTPFSLDLPSSVNVPLLRVLHLNDFDIQAGQLDDALFSAIPCLETLNLEDCRFSLKKLSIEYTCKLKTLLMTGSFLNHFELSISAPNLKFLKLNSCSLHDSIKTMRFENNCIQLSNAYIGLGVSCPQSVIELFAVLQNTSSLILSPSFLKSFTSQLQNGLGIMDCIKTPFQYLTHMELGTVFSDEEARVINNILCHSPCIEVLRIEVPRTYDVTVGESFEAADVWSVFNLSRLKLVEINDFQATTKEIRFVKFILENASVLEDMIISTTRFGPRSTRMKKVGKELLLYPRASPTLVMQFG